MVLVEDHETVAVSLVVTVVGEMEIEAVGVGTGVAEAEVTVKKESLKSLNTCPDESEEFMNILKAPEAPAGTRSRGIVHV